MSPEFVVSFCCCCPSVAVNAQETSNESTPIIIGQAVTLYATVLNQKRCLLVYLPKSYQRANN